MASGIGFWLWLLALASGVGLGSWLWLLACDFGCGTWLGARYQRCTRDALPKEGPHAWLSHTFEPHMRNLQGLLSMDAEVEMFVLVPDDAAAATAKPDKEFDNALEAAKRI